MLHATHPRVVDWHGTPDDVELTDLRTWAPRPTERIGLLIDLENLALTTANPHRARRILTRILTAAGHPDTCFAVAADRALTPAVRTALADLGIAVRTVRTGPDSADRALVTHARAWRNQGVTRFVVASADHYFTRVADLGPLTVITTPDHPVSRRLADAATRVLVA